ncbi:Asp-tRNA(Asn)/Glu-tRNA(Gln) amidotransferase subunit GatA [Candidatus Microgenomates bacterium]|nr:Asp-tRNA(Asn)/Glu-tRNA(Gln) amidotransferase subunit GatA [Candidatus Microgenomates bacterium]
MFERLTIRSASELLDAGKTTSVDLTKYYLDRIKKYDADIGAFLLVAEEYALQKAGEADERIKSGKKRGMLDGIPFAVKDVILTEGIETTAASKILQGYIPPYSATVIEKLEEAGAVMLGKLNCDEFAMGSSTENSAYQITKNPWDKTRVPGGSSGGSAAALSADFCVFALGTDTGGSIRQPASMCSITGLKPSYGRVSRYGAIPYGSSLDQIGPMGKSAEDIGIVLEAIAGVDELDSTTVGDISDFRFQISDLNSNQRNLQSTIYNLQSLKIGLPKEYFATGLDPEVKKIVLDAVEEYRKLGAQIVEVSLPHTEYAIPAYYLIVMGEVSSNLARYDGIKYGASAIKISNLKSQISNLAEVYIKTRSQYLGDEAKRKIILGTFELSAGYYDAYYKKAQSARALIKNDFDDIFEQVDLLMTPVSPFPAFKIGEKKDDPLSMYLADIYTISANLAGICGMSIPAGFTAKGLPVGLQVLGPRFGEEKLLSAGIAFQNATDWHTKYPEIK